MVGVGTISFPVVPTLILLIRHALTDTAGKKLTGWQPGIHLNDRGREQADRLAERLRPVRIGAIYSSSLERCLETAEPLARDRGLDVDPLESLRDVDYGTWSGRTLGPLRRTKLWSSLVASPANTRFPGGETLRETQGRMLVEVASIVDRLPRGAVAVVSHADPIKLVLAHHLGVHVDLFTRIVVHPASVSALLLGAGAPVALKVNDTGDLSDLALPRRKPRR